jgi:TRAP-type C4-dicarboxylate transport system permease large subunit
MAYYISKVIITTLLIVLISEISKRSSFMGAVLASIPLVSVLAMIWLYVDTKDVSKISELSFSIFWLVLPSLTLFLALPLLLKQGVNFYWSMATSIGVTILCYWLMISVLNYLGVKL